MQGKNKSTQMEKQQHHDRKVFSDEELTNIVDLVLKEDDLNGDGYIEYVEFVNPLAYMQWMNPAAYASLMNPVNYMEPMNPVNEKCKRSLQSLQEARDTEDPEEMNESEGESVHCALTVSTPTD